MSVTSRNLRIEPEQIDARPLPIKLLLLVGRSGLAMHHQTKKLLLQELLLQQQQQPAQRVQKDQSPDRDLVQRAESCITDAIEKGHLAWCTEVVGSANAEEQIVLYLTERGYRKVRNFSEDLGDELTYGPPSDRQLADYKHTLLITESLLWWNKDHRIYGYENESHLRGRNERIKRKNKKLGYSEDSRSNNSLADYLIDWRHRRKLDLSATYCEIMIQYSVSRIEHKSKGYAQNLVWFTDSEIKANKINTLTGQRVHVLPSPVEDSDPVFTGTVRAALEKRLRVRRDNFLLTDTQRLILDVLSEIKAVVSVENLARATGASQLALKIALRGLIAKKLVKYRRAVVCAEDKKRRRVYYYLPECEKFLSGSKFQQNVLLNELYYSMPPSSGELYDYDLNAPAICLSSKEDIEMFMADDWLTKLPENNLQSVQSVLARFDELRTTVPHRVIIAVTDKSRLATFIKAVGKKSLLDMTGRNLSID